MKNKTISIIMSIILLLIFISTYCIQNITFVDKVIISNGNISRKLQALEERKSISMLNNLRAASNIIDLNGNAVSSSDYLKYIENVNNTIDSPTYQWTANGRTLTNLPITDWTRSSNSVMFNRVKSGIVYSWNWDTISSLNEDYKDESQVWDLSRNINHGSNGYIPSGKVSIYNGVLYDAAGWYSSLVHSRYNATEEMWQFKGTFNIDPTLDMSNLYFTLTSVASDSKIYLNDNMYVFIYPKCIEKEINSNSNSDKYFMNFFAYWCGTVATATGVNCNFHGVAGNQAQDGSISGLNITRYFMDAVKDNAGKAIQYGYDLVHNLAEYDGTYVIRVIGADINGGGAMYRQKLGYEFKAPKVSYVGNGATGNIPSQEKISGTPLSIKSSDGFIREGYKFKEWNTAADGSGKTYLPDDEYTDEDGIILYAQWEKEIDLEEKISIELTKTWKDNEIQALRRPDKIKFVVMPVEEKAEEAVTIKEEIISSNNMVNEEIVSDVKNINIENSKENIEVDENIKENDSTIESKDLLEENEEFVKEITNEKGVLDNIDINAKSRINNISDMVNQNNLTTDNKIEEVVQEDEKINNITDENVEEKVNSEETEISSNDIENKLDENITNEENQKNELVEESKEEKIIEESNINAIQETIEPNDLEQQNETLPKGEKIEYYIFEFTEDVKKDENTSVYTFEGIPKYDKTTGKPIKYIIKEMEVNNGDLKFYKSTGGTVKETTDSEGKVKYMAEVVNTFELPEDNKKDVTVTKVWNDNNDRTSTRPTNIILELIARTQNIEEIEVSNTTDWKHTFKSLPIYDENGQEIEYTLQEKADQEILDKYISEVSEINESNEIIVTNSLIIQDSKIEKTGTEEINAIDSKVNYSIDYTFELDNKYAENANIEIVDTLPYQIDEKKSDLNGGTYSYNEETKVATITWTGIYNSIDKTVTLNNNTEEVIETTENKERNVQVITVHLEIGITYKDVQVSTEKITNSVSGKITLANDVTDIVEDSFETETRWVKDVIVNKRWKGDTEKTRPESIELQLLATTKDENNQDVEYVIDESIETTKTLSKDTDWTATLWAELPSYDETGKEIHYMVKEIDIDGYKSEILQINEENSKVEITIQNTKWYKLPITGGIGVDTIRSAEVLVGIIALILITNRKKVVPERRSKVEAKKIKRLEKLAKKHKIKEL